MSDLTLTSYSDNGTSYTYNFTLCIGFGITGFVQGADLWTGTFAFLFYGCGSTPLNVLSTYPNTITSSFRGCSMYDDMYGPIPGCLPPDVCGPPYYNDIDYAIFYTNAYCDLPGNGPCLPPCDLGFTCILNSSQCGNVNQDCFNFTFITESMIDSLRVAGVEGGGQLFTTCYPNQDMLFAYSDCKLPISWAYTRTTQLPQSVVLEWGTADEEQGTLHEVMRRAPGGTFTPIFSFESKGGTLVHHSYTDTVPFPQGGQYQIRLTLPNGSTLRSEVMEVQAAPQQPLAWLDQEGQPLSFWSSHETTVRLRLADLAGRVMHEESIQAVAGSNIPNLNLASQPAGAIVATLTGNGHRLVRKFAPLR